MVKKKNDDTKFFFISFDSNLKEIPLNDAVHGSRIEKNQQFDNWFFAQMNATIRYAFLKYGLPIPKFAYIDRSYRNCDEMIITLVRGNINSQKTSLKWYNNIIYVQDELNLAGMANTSEDITFKFKII